MSRPGRLLPAVLSLLLLAGCGPIGRTPGEELCDALDSDLESAITASPELPDLRGANAMRFGSCSATTTKRFDVRVPGLERHRKVTISGSLAMDSGLNLRRLKAVSEEGTANQVTELPQLGPDAFIVVRTGHPQADTSDSSVASEPQGPGSASDPASALPLPATAYWRRGKTVFSASATRDGASIEETTRATQRLAELINRRPAQERID